MDMLGLSKWLGLFLWLSSPSRSWAQQTHIKLEQGDLIGVSFLQTPCNIVLLQYIDCYLFPYS